MRLFAADLTGLNRNTVNRYFRLLRERIAEICERESPFQGEVELDESWADHGADEFVEQSNRRNHVDGIESFWGYARNRLVKFQGIIRADFNLHLKGYEFRFNMRDRNFYKYLLKEFRKNHLT